MDNILVLVDGNTFKFDSVQVTLKSGVYIPCIRFIEPSGEYHVFAGEEYRIPNSADEADRMYELFPGISSHTSGNNEWLQYTDTHPPKEYIIESYGRQFVFTRVDYIYMGETEAQQGYLIHDLEDEFYNGDVILLDFDEESLPKTSDERNNFFVQHSSECTTHMRYAGCGLWHIFA